MADENPFASVGNIFGTADVPTYEELKRRRAIAAALAARQRGFPKNIGEGLTYLGESIGEAIGDWRARNEERLARTREGGVFTRAPAEPTVAPVTPNAPTTAAKPVPVIVPQRPGEAPIPGSIPIVPPSSFAPVPAGGLGNVPTIAVSPSPDTTPPAPDVPVPDVPVQTDTDISPVPSGGGPDTPVPAPPPPPELTPTPVVAPPVTPPPSVNVPMPRPRPEQAPVPEAPVEPPRMGDSGATRDAIALALVNQDKPAAVGPEIPWPPLPPRGPSPGDTGPIVPRRVQTESFTRPPEPLPAPAARPVVSNRSSPPPQGWAATDPRWAALSDDQKAAAMAMMEANAGPNAAQDRINVLAAIHNRADRDKTTIGSSVSRRIYQPVIEASQQARLDRILQDPAHAELTALSKQYGEGAARPHDATHFLAPEKVLLDLEARNPGKYRAWRGWTGFNPETGQYSGVKFRDSSHAFLTPGEGGNTSAPAPQPQAPQAPPGPPVQTLAVSPAPSMREQPQQASMPSTPEDIAQDRLLREVAMGGRPSLLGRGATAARGDIGSDAPPLARLGTMGSSTPGMDADVMARRDAITGALLGQQPAPAPDVPPPADAGKPPVRIAQAGALTPDMFGPPVYRDQGVRRAPGTGTPNDTIRPAPSALPSTDAIPEPAPRLPQGPQEPFKPEPMSAREQYMRGLARDQYISDMGRSRAEQEYKELEQQRLKRDERRWQQWTNEQAQRAAEPGRILDEAQKRANLQEQQYRINQIQPLEAAVKRAEQQLREAEVSRIPIEQEKARIALDQAKVALDQARRTFEKPDEISVGGTVLQRPYTPAGQPQQPYAVAPGAPPVKEEMTADQAHAQEFVRRVKPDLDLLDYELRKGYILTQPVEAIRGITNITASDEYRRANQAWTNFEGGFMQRTSGAAVSPSEAQRNLPAFKPMVGDTPRELEDKARRRRDFTDAVEKSAGPAGATAIKQVLQDSSDHLYEKQNAKPAVRVNKPGDELLLPPGQRFIGGDGVERVIPRRKY